MTLVGVASGIVIGPIVGGLLIVVNDWLVAREKRGH